MMKKKASDDPKKYQDNIFALLKSMEIAPKGFYDYEEFSDLVGLQKPQWPYKNFSKVVIEISKVKLTPAQVAGFATLAKENQAVKALVFGVEERIALDPEVAAKISTIGIEYFDPKDLEELLKKVTVSEESTTIFRNASDVVSPQRLVNGLPLLAQQLIPTDIDASMKAMQATEMPAWEIFEEATYASFHFCLSYTTYKLGKEARFKDEPEGMVVVEGQNRFAFLYDCKSSNTQYNMSKDNERAYVDYINAKKPELTAIHSAELRYFVIVAPSFGGDMKERKRSIQQTSGVFLVYLEASNLRKLAQWAFNIKNIQIRRLIDLGEVFSKADGVLVEEKSLEEYIEEFDRKYKSRY